MTASDTRLAEIQARVDAASEGPWGNSLKWIVIAEREGLDSLLGTMLHEPDAEFIAHARDDIPYLLALLSAARADGWDEGYEAADNNTPRSRKGHWEDDRPRKGLRTWIPDPLPSNPYRSQETHK